MERIGDAIARHFGAEPGEYDGEHLPCLEDAREKFCPDLSWEDMAEVKRMREEVIRDEQFKQWRMSKMRKTHVPKTFLDARADSRWAQAFLDKPGVGLYIYGETGTGKTWQACGIIIEYTIARILREKHPAVFKRFGDILDDCIKYGRPETLDFYMHVPLLCLDDLGKEKPTEYALETLYRLIDTRRAERLSTIITSNLDPKGLASYFCIDGGRLIGDAILERLKDYTIIHATQRYQPING